MSQKFDFRNAETPGVEVDEVDFMDMLEGKQPRPAKSLWDVIQNLTKSIRVRARKRLRKAVLFLGGTIVLSACWVIAIPPVVSAESINLAALIALVWTGGMIAIDNLRAWHALHDSADELAGRMSKEEAQELEVEAIMSAGDDYIDEEGLC